ncbi:MAG: hypothetical protein QG584_522 [Pseudomonadota bacterium]|nr:hypothetical protein [Pseudomonadota bacterium]
MLQTIRATTVNTHPNIKSVSAQKKYARSKTPKQRNARIAWKRIKDNIDDLVLETGANPELGSVISRWVLFGHLTRAEGYAARLYGEVVGAYHRFHIEGRSGAKSPSYERGTAGAQDVIAKKERDGTIVEYERAARQAKKRYDRIVKVLNKFPLAKDKLDEVCVHDREIASEFRPHLKIVLKKVGQEFGVIAPDRKQEDM